MNQDPDLKMISSIPGEKGSNNGAPKEFFKEKEMQEDRKGKTEAISDLASANGQPAEHRSSKQCGKY